MYSCKYSKYCGACINLEKNYEKIILDKKAYLENLFKDNDNIVIENIVENYFPLKYRNKVHLAFKSFKGKTIIGFFEDGSTKVVDIDACLLFSDWLKTLIAILREYVSRFKIKPYDEVYGGIIRYAHARCINNNLQLTLVVTTENFAGRSWLLHKLSESFKTVSFYLNINNRTDRAIFSDKFKFVGGEKYLNFNLCGFKVAIQPNSFLQVNLNIAEKMYKKAMELMDLNIKVNVLDLYSGIGISSMLFSKKCNLVLSIEENSSAVINAKNMAKLNNISNVKHFIGKCEDVISKIDINENYVVFLDPARAGANENLLKTLINKNVKKIVYMSCCEETLKRDIDILTKNKYICTKILPYDMFPFTKHIECLCVLNHI